jgi:uncharacterized membrane protein YhaH (DUF805 family)
MAANPYTPPKAKVADVGTEEFQPVKLWSASGRIGRLRYLAYSIGASMLVGVVAAVLAPAIGPALGAAIALLLYIPLLVFNVLIGIQRSHDMDWSGWTILLAIIPLVGLIWLFKAGSPGENRFGAPPPPNTTGVKVLGLIFPLIAFIGIVAAIALPAYQTYVKRAQESQQSR